MELVQDIFLQNEIIAMIVNKVYCYDCKQSLNFGANKILSMTFFFLKIYGIAGCCAMERMGSAFGAVHLFV